MDQVLFKGLLPGAKDGKFKSGKLFILVGAIMALSGGVIFFSSTEPMGAVWLIVGLGSALLALGGVEFFKGAQMTSCTLLVARNAVNSRIVLLLEGKGVLVEVHGPLTMVETHFGTGTIIMDEEIHRYMVTFRGSKGESITLYDRMSEDKLPSSARLTSKSLRVNNLYQSDDLGGILFSIEELQAQNSH